MIDSLPDELLVEILDWCRLESLDDEYGWNYRRRWYNLLQVCRRWRHVMLEWATRLKLRVLCNSANPMTTIPSHLTQIPLIIRFKFLYPVPTLFRKNSVLALQNRDRVYGITISNWGLEDLGLHKALDSAFPMLETLSLAEAHARRALPFNFVAPHLRALHLRNIDVPMGCLSLPDAMNLSSLRLEKILALPLEFLVECIASMPYLEDISINFIQDPPLAHAVIESPSTQITCVVLPRLSRLMFSGFSTYLENLLTQISTPFLQDLRFTIFLKRIPSVVRLSPFLGTLQNLNFQTAVMWFSGRYMTISYHPDQPSVAPPYAKFTINRPTAGDDEDWRTSILQICSDVAPALSVVESLALESYLSSFYRSAFRIQPTIWNTILRPYVGVKTLTINRAFVAELSDVLDPTNGVVITELLPVLSEIVIVSSESRHLVLLDQPFSSFVDVRRLAGSPIDIRVIQPRHPPSLSPPPISWSFDTFF